MHVNPGTGAPGIVCTCPVMTFRMASTEYASMLSTARLADSSVSESKGELFLLRREAFQRGQLGFLV